MNLFTAKDFMSFDGEYASPDAAAAIANEKLKQIPSLVNAPTRPPDFTEIHFEQFTLWQRLQIAFTVFVGGTLELRPSTERKVYRREELI